MEPEGSLPCAHKPSTVSYPEPDQSSRYNLILSPLHRLGLPSGVFPFGFATKIVYIFLCSACELHALFIPSSLT
jgi:hypothetical protein